MADNVKLQKEKKNRRTLGVHLTSTDTFKKYIFPDIENLLQDYLWVDLYAGEGNLILPILDFIPKEERKEFFKEHIFLADVQEEMVSKCIKNALNYDIPQNLAEKNILLRDNLANYPKFLRKRDLPIFHITNPPYLYLGYIRKHEETKIHLKLFEGKNKGYQDLYQIAMINDMRNKVEKLVYIIPSNFIFGAAVSNKFRTDFLKHYSINKMLVFEKQIFEFTGTNICIVFLEKKKFPRIERLKFLGTKFKKNDVVLERKYRLIPEFKYRGGAEFDEFTVNYTFKKPLKVKYYLLREEVEIDPGDQTISVIDTNNYKSNEYLKLSLEVNEKLAKRVKENILYVRTVDTGSWDGRAGLYEIKEDFDVDGIYVSKATYRTSPIQIFLTPQISSKDQRLLKEYFNFTLEFFRNKLDCEFLTTYKYSSSEYTRKYLGLTQVRKIIQCCPIHVMDSEAKKELSQCIREENFKGIKKVISLNSEKPVDLPDKKNYNKVDLTNWL